MAEITEEAIIQQLRRYNCVVEPCGSRVTCNPAPVGTDQDYLVEVPSNNGDVALIVNELSALGFQWEGSSEHYQDAAGNDFMSWRRGDVNFIVTTNAGFAERHRMATDLCKRLNLMDKQDRIALFQVVLYGNRKVAAAPKFPVSIGDDLPW